MPAPVSDKVPISIMSQVSRSFSAKPPILRMSCS